MSETNEHKFEVEVDVEAAINALERLTAAADRAAVAIGKLEGAQHGGITIRSVGDVVSIDVRPSAETPRSGE